MSTLAPNFKEDQITRFGEIVYPLHSYWFHLISGTRSFSAKRLSELGRMSLSNYILVSLLCSFIFYGHGFALFEDIDRSLQAVFLLGLWAVMMIFTAVWPNFFRFGSLEWLW